MVHTFYLNGYYIALDVNSGAVHVLDKLCFDLLNKFGDKLPEEFPSDILEELSAEYEREELIEVYSELLELQKAGQLFSEDDYERFTDMMKGAPIKSMCLHIIADPSEPYAITEEDLPAIFAEYEKLAVEMIRRKKEEGRCFNFFHFMIDLDQGPCAIKRLRGCGCGNEYVSVTPDGDIYPCHQFVGNDEWKMGNLDDETLDIEMKDKFACSNIYTKEGCRDCWCKFYCSGGCNANNYSFNKDINKPVKLPAKWKESVLNARL